MNYHVVSRFSLDIPMLHPDSDEKNISMPQLRDVPLEMKIE